MSRWSAVALGTVFEVQLGKMLDAKGNTGTPYPYLANRNVQWGRCDLQDLPTMRFTESDRKRFDLRAGDLLVCEGGEVGRTAIWEGAIAECYFQKAIHRLRGRRPVDARFALHYMRWAADNGTFRNLTTATSIAHLTKEKLELAPFPDAPFHEQQRIATILDAADALRTKRREALAQLDSLTQAIFIEMFGDPATNPRRWSRKALGELMTEGPQNGLYKPASEYGSGSLILRIDGFYDGKVTGMESLKRVRLSADEIRSYGLKPGDIVINRVNSMEYLGKSAVIPPLAEAVVFQSNMMRFRANQEVANPDYVIAFLQSGFVKSQIHTAAKHAVNQSSINQQDVRGFQINVPPLPLQREFSVRAAAVETLKAAHRASLAEMDALFASLQHRAFRGEL